MSDQLLTTVLLNGTSASMPSMELYTTGKIIRPGKPLHPGLTLVGVVPLFKTSMPLKSFVFPVFVNILYPRYSTGRQNRCLSGWRRADNEILSCGLAMAVPIHAQS
jgi:hypothetical protein